LALTKHASFQVLAARIAREGEPLMRTAHRVEFDYEPKPGFLYVRSRAISSRTNDNFDEFPAEEIKAAYRTFIGKPVFVNHHNANHRRARGVIIDAALHEDVNPDGTPDTWAEVLMEVDAIRFPRLAEAIVQGHIERTSMGTDVAYSICSACGNKAASPLEYCQHIPRMKGKRIYRTTASGAKEGVLVREICYGLGFFENSLLVEEPADPTAFFLGVDTRGLEMVGAKTVSRHAMPAEPRHAAPSLALPGMAQRTADREVETISGYDANQGTRYQGTNLSKDDEGYFVSTHRARSKSYPTPEEIPDSAIKFIESTGGRLIAAVQNKAVEVGDYINRGANWSRVTAVEPNTEPGDDFTKVWVTTEDGVRSLEFPRMLTGDSTSPRTAPRPAGRPLNWDDMGSSEKDLWQERFGAKTEGHKVASKTASGALPTTMKDGRPAIALRIDSHNARRGIEGFFNDRPDVLEEFYSWDASYHVYLMAREDYEALRNGYYSRARWMSSVKEVKRPPAGAEWSHVWGSKHQAITFDQGGRTTAPADVDTLRDEACPVCGETDAYDGEQCPVCGFIKPPDEFGDPDLSKAQQVDLRQDGEQEQAERLKCDNCGAVFVGGTKVALVLDKDRDAAESTDTSMNVGDVCPECGEGTLQADGQQSETDVQTDEDGFAPAGSATEEQDPQEAEDDAMEADLQADDGQDDEDATVSTDVKSDPSQDDSTDPQDDEEESDEEDGKPPFKKKKPTAARRGNPTRRSAVEMARPALEALREQQRMIVALRRKNAALTAVVAMVVDAAGLRTHPRVASLMKAAEDENPGTPDGWAIPGQPSTEAPAATTDEAATPAGTDDPTSVGATPVTDVSPDATTDVASTGGTVADEPLDLNEQTVTDPVAGTDDLGEGPRGEAGSGRTETEVRAGTPADNSPAFQDGGFLSSKGQERTMASLRLARLRIQAGIASADDDLVLSQTIASSDQTDEAIAAEIATLGQVMQAAAARGGQPQRRVARSVVPQSARQDQRAVPSLSSEAAVLPQPSISTPVSSDEVAFE